MLKPLHSAIAYSLIVTFATLDASSSPKQQKYNAPAKTYPKNIAGACDKTADWLARCNKATLTARLDSTTTIIVEKRDLMLAFMQATRAHNEYIYHSYHSLETNPAELFATILPTLRKNNEDLLNMDPEKRRVLVNTLDIADTIAQLATHTSPVQFCLETTTLQNGQCLQTEHSHT